MDQRRWCLRSAPRRSFCKVTGGAFLTEVEQTARLGRVKGLHDKRGLREERSPRRVSALTLRGAGPAGQRTAWSAACTLTVRPTGLRDLLESQKGLKRGRGQ